MSEHALQDVSVLCDDYDRLNAQRSDIDKRIVELPPADFQREILWDELETTLARLRELLGLVANTWARNKAELRAKAAILATVLRSADAGSGPIVPAHSITALALSLTDDIAESLH
jgi:hypothetical protein